MGLDNQPFDLNELHNLSNIFSLKAEEKGLELIRRRSNNAASTDRRPVSIEPGNCKLTVNAMKFTEKGHIILSIRSEELDSKGSG